MNNKRSDPSGGGQASRTLDEPWARRLAAEAFGTAALVFVAAGADTINLVTHGAVTPVARAVAPGLIVAALIYSLGDVSGAHFNPSVTIAFTARGLLPPTWVIPYVAAQVAGGLLAAGLLRLFLGGAVAPIAPPQIAPLGAFGFEIVLTSLLVTVILGTADRYRIVGPDAALAVGATIAVCGLVALPAEGASLNPARALGPAVLAGRYDDLWVYTIGPLVGSVLGAILTRTLHGPVMADSKTREAARGANEREGRTARP